MFVHVERLRIHDRILPRALALLSLSLSLLLFTDMATKAARLGEE
jgi:hypothetical protein